MSFTFNRASQKAVLSHPAVQQTVSDKQTNKQQQNKKIDGTYIKKNKITFVCIVTYFTLFVYIYCYVLLVSTWYGCSSYSSH